MATTTLVFNRKSVSFSDIDTAILIHFLIEEVVSDPMDYEDLFGAAKNWRLVFQNYGPGVIYPFELEKDLVEPKAKNQFLAALSKVESRLNKFGVSIPASYCQKEIALTGVQFQDQETERLLLVSNQIRSMLQ